MSRNIGLCRLCLQKNKPLVKSHVIPQSFFNKNSMLVTDSELKPQKRPIGPYDREILCEKCDRDLGNDLDSYAKRVLIDREHVISQVFYDPARVHENIILYRLTDKKGYDKIIRFFISVLWRASIASQRDFETVNLGSYEEIARTVILDQNFDFRKYFSVSLFLFSDIAEKIHLISSRIRIEGVSFYIFVIGSIKVYIKCDKQKIPPSMAPLIISPINDILMIKDALSRHYEDKIFKRLAKKLIDYRLQNNMTLT